MVRAVALSCSSRRFSENDITLSATDAKSGVVMSGKKQFVHDENMVNTAAIQSSRKAYSMAGLGPSDIDVFEVYDCFTYMVLVQLEDYGFCKKGEGGPYVASGALRLSGGVPTNTAGGKLSEGHAEGMLQIVEAARQIRRDYVADRQVRNPEVAVVSGHGGNTVCHNSLILTSA